MKRKYFNTKNKFQFLERDKNCFLHKRYRRLMQKTKKAAFSFAPTFNGMYFLDKFFKKKINLYLKSFFFFKMHMFNNFSSYWGSLGYFFFTNLDFYFLKHFVFFNKTEELVKIFKSNATEEIEEDLKYLNEFCAIQTVFDNKVSLDVYENKIKKKTFNIFLDKIKIKKKNVKLLNFFFLLFILKKIK